MASYRPFPPPPQSTFGPPPNQNQNHLPPPPPPPPPAAGAAPQPQFPQTWGGYGSSDGSFNSQSYNSQMHPNSGFQAGGYGSSSSSSSQLYGHSSRNQLPPPNHQQQQAQYPYQPPPPPPDSSYPAPPPPSISQSALNLPPQPAPMYYSSSQYTQFNHQPMQPLQPPPPPPPPSSPPPSSLIPPPPPPPSLPPSPPPPPSSAPPVGRAKVSKPDGLNQRAPLKQHKPPIAPASQKKSNGLSGRIETEEERRQRKKREFEKQRQDEKHRQQLKQSQNAMLQKAQMFSSGAKGTGSISGSRMGERRPTPLLSGERIENRLKKPTTFICKLKFRNELPDPTAQPKLLSLRRDKDRYTKYRITSLEKMHKPQLYVEPDLGIPLDLLDLSVYNPPKGEKLLLDPEDEELLRDDDPVTPVKKDGIKRKERPTDKGVSWLVKTQYISPLSTEATKQSLTEKQAKDLREARNNILDDFNNRERRIQEIEASFKACKSRPVHSTNSSLQPVEIFPLLPDFDRYDDQFAIATFDNAPTADSENYRKLDKSVRDAYESRAVMKSYVATGVDTAKPDKFLAYMVPSPEELSKDIYDENEDVSYTWVREYHWDVRGDDADDPATYLVGFGESEARYLPLPTKLILRKKRAREGKSSDEVEHFPVPSRVTVRRRSTVAAIELKESGSYAASQRGKDDIEDGLERRHKAIIEDQDDQSSGAEYDMSD